MRAAAHTLEATKAGLVASGDEAGANRILAVELAVNGWALELDMWDALDEKRHEDAWNLLMQAQQQANGAQRVDPVAPEYPFDVQHRLALECLLFPPQAFLSSGMVVHKASCSICGSDYDLCPHVKGYAYGGDMCVRCIEKADLLEVSIVKDPADKRCVATFDGIDPFTLLPRDDAG